METIQIKDYWIKRVYCPDCGREMIANFKSAAPQGMYVYFGCENNHQIVMKLVQNEKAIS